MFPLYDENRIRGRIPSGTILLIVLNAVFFFYTYPDLGYYVSLFGFFPDRLFDGQFFTVMTSMFLHGSFWHLLGNMWFLWIFGDSLESKLGSVKFLLFYLLCGVGSAVGYATAKIGPRRVRIAELVRRHRIPSRVDGAEHSACQAFPGNLASWHVASAFLGPKREGAKMPSCQNATLWHMARGPVGFAFGCTWARAIAPLPDGRVSFARMRSNQRGRAAQPLLPWKAGS